MWSFLWYIILPVSLLSCALPVFLTIYDTTKSVVDEEFHLKQGLSFCNQQFDVWDSKITTFPGLYLAAVVLGPLNLCSVFGLRLLSLIASVVNILLFYKLRRLNRDFGRNAEAALDAFTMALLPPLFFFSHLYYTDVMALTFVLLFYYNWLKDAQLYSAVYGAASVLMRQTNVIWIAMTVGVTALDSLFLNYAKQKELRIVNVRIFDWNAWYEILTSYDIILRSIWQTFVRSALSLLVILPFVVFVLLNGSIVVGDKSAHVATFHLPQLFYFSLFTMVFAVTHSFVNLRAVLQMFSREKLITIFVLGVLILIVKWNTLVHPYLLADNRHYTFYIWNRFYGRYAWFKYAMTPVYLLSLALLVRCLTHCRDSFQFMFWLSVILMLCFQRLVEIRYFLTPFILMRLHMKRIPRARWSNWIELFVYAAINVVTLYIFFTKNIMWFNYPEPQRLMW